MGTARMGNDPKTSMSLMGIIKFMMLKMFMLLMGHV